MIAIQPKSRQLLGVNQQAYQALKASMSLNLRRQLLIAVCDDVRMQSLLATQLEKDLAQAPARALSLERLMFDAEEGNLPQQVAQWVRQTLLARGTLPAVQMLGIEQMIHQPAITQNYFLRSLEKIEALLPRLDTSLLVWLPWPWLRTIQQSSPTFWNWRNGVFEFVSDPTPTEGEGKQPFANPNEPAPSTGSTYQDGPASQHKVANRKKILPPAAEQPPIGSLYGESASDGSGNIASSGSIERSSEVPKRVPKAVPEEFTYDFELEALLKEPASANSDLSKVDEDLLATQVAKTTQEIYITEVPLELLDDGIDNDELLLELIEQESNDDFRSDGSEDRGSEDKNPEDSALEASFFADDILQNTSSPGGLRSVVLQGINVAQPGAQSALRSAFQSDLRLAEPTDAEGAAEIDVDEPSMDESEFASLDWDDFVDSSNGSDSVAELPGDASDTLLKELVELVRNEPVQGGPVRSQPVDVKPTQAIPVEDERIQVHPVALDRLRPEPLQPEQPQPKQPIAPAVTLSESESQRSLLSNLASEAQSEREADEDNIQQAAGYFAIGLSYRNRIEAGERSLDVIELAIAAYESGLNLLTEPDPDWITGLNDLGTLYWLKAQQQAEQQAVDSMNRSIELYQEALEKSQAALGDYAIEAQPDIIGQLYSNMGAVYTVLATFEDPLEHLEKAAQTYNRAVPLASLEHNPEEYATLQNSLGSVFWKLSHYDSAAVYLHHAIAAYSEALLGYRPDQKPLDYAAVQNNLGITYWSLAKHERPEFLLKHAIAAYRDALNYRTSEVDPAACAISYNNLALAYWDLSKHTQGDLAQKSRYQKNAITAFEAALNINKSSGSLNAMDSAAIYHCLGDVHAQTIETAPSLVEVGESLQKSLYSYIKAVEGLPTDSPAYPGRFAAVVANLKLHYEKLGLEGQQSALNRVPPSLLSQVMMAL